MIQRLSILALFFAAFAFPQAVSYQNVSSTTDSACAPGALCPIKAIPGATVNVCSGAGLGFVSTAGTVATLLSGPSFTGASGSIQIAGITYQIQTVVASSILVLTTSAGTQTNVVYSTLTGCLAAPVTTYTDPSAATACPPTAQLNPVLGGACTSTTDNQGTLNFWALPGQYYYYLSVPATAGGGSFGPYPISIGTSAGCPLGVTCDANYATLGAAFTAAGTGTLYITKPWGAQLSANYSAPIQCMGNAKIQPASGQVVTFGGAILNPSPQQCFDTSLGGAGSVKFSSPPPPVLPELFAGKLLTTVSSPSIDLWAPLNSAQASLPVINTNAQGLNSVSGLIQLQSTGPVSNGSSPAYSLSNTFELSAYTTLAGVPTNGTTITVPANFATSSQKFMFDTINVNGAGRVYNDNFYEVIRDVSLIANQNAGNNFASCINWGVSIGSQLLNLTCQTSSLGIQWGGTPPQSADNISAANLSFNLVPATGAPCPVAMTWMPAGPDVSANTLLNVKVATSGPNAQVGCAYQPVIQVGNQNTGIHIDGMGLEGVENGIVVAWSANDISMTGIQAIPDFITTTCPTVSNFPHFALIDGISVNVKIKGYMRCYTWPIVIGSWWNPSTAYTTTGYPNSVIDPNNCIQLLTGNGTSGAYQQPTWGGSSSSGCTAAATTSDGTATWTNQGAVARCSTVSANTVTEATNCAPFPGAASNSDTSFYPFDFDNGNHFRNGSETINGPLTSISVQTIQTLSSYINVAQETAGSANNAIVAQTNLTASLMLVSPINNGACFSVIIEHTLATGSSNTIQINGGTVYSVHSHLNSTVGLVTGYTASMVHPAIINVCVEGGFMLDMSQ